MQYCIDHIMYVHVFHAYGLVCNTVFRFEKSSTFWVIKGVNIKLLNAHILHSFCRCCLGSCTCNKAKLEVPWLYLQNSMKETEGRSFKLLFRRNNTCDSSQFIKCVSHALWWTCWSLLTNQELLLGYKITK